MQIFNKKKFQRDRSCSSRHLGLLGFERGAQERRLSVESFARECRICMLANTAHDGPVPFLLQKEIFKYH